jgi:hypothetical protein
MLREHERKIMNVIPARPELSRRVDEGFSAGSLNPDSAVALSRKREVEPFRSKVDGFLPLSKPRSAVLGWNVKARHSEVRKREMTLKFHSRTPSLLQGSTSLPGSSLIAESGLSVALRFKA